jgi:hypothetical protein
MQTAASTRWAGFHGLLGHIDFVGNKKKCGPSSKQSTKCPVKLISTTFFKIKEALFQYEIMFRPLHCMGPLHDTHLGEPIQISISI